MAELHAVREALNELPYHHGKRRVWLGNTAELFPGADEETIAGHLRKIEQELAEHGLSLAREEADFYAEQELRQRAVDLSWLGEATAKATQIITVALEMVLPGVAGYWLDRQFGVSFLALLGLAIGVPLGIWHLILMTKRKTRGHS